jgi:hypothetical protein
MTRPFGPFDSIEGAYEYLRLLGDAVEDALGAIEEDTARAQQATEAERRVEALRLVGYKLKQLRDHLVAGRRILNDLRMLRRLLLSEREDTLPPADAS